MHVLVVNDDGPPSNESSPYVHSLVHSFQSAGHVVSVVLPNQQRSWIGKALLVGAAVTPTYFRPGTLHQDDGTVHHLPRDADEEGDEWILVNSTPASCVQIGLYHYFQDRGPVDIVVSGPNYGRNSTTLFAMSSGTIGGAMEAALCGRKSIALSYAFSSRNHDPVVIAEASKHSVRLIEYLFKNWSDGVDLYTINVPIEPGVSESKIVYTHMLDNRWTRSCFQAIDAEAAVESPELQEHRLREAEETGKLSANGSTENNKPNNRSKIQHKHFKWAPDFTDVYKSVEDSQPGNDGRTVKEGMTSVTPLKANFMHAPGLAQGEIKLSGTREPVFYYSVELDSPYVQPLIEEALRKQVEGATCQSISSLSDLPDPSAPVLQYREYENLDFEHALSHPSSSLVNSFVIRKALIRKHYLSNTVANWISKHPDSILRKHVKPAVDFEVDYAEFLDEALMEAYELRESLEANESKAEQDKEWWILKPGMSDRGQGIRLFNSEAQLQAIFEEWEDDESDEEDDADEDGIEPPVDENLAKKNGQGVVTSQLRHFIAQPYIDPPLLLPSASNRKFHIRTYVLAVGSLKIYVFKEMLALFSNLPYQAPWEETDEVRDLARHLTNTCLQEGGSTNEGSVKRFWDLDGSAPRLPSNWKDNVFDQICAITAEIFEAAARGMLVHFQTLPNAFEIFGVDFLVDQTGNTWLLELNAFPDFGQTGEELKKVVVRRLFEEVVDVAVKPFFGFGEAAQPKEERGLKLVASLDLGRKI